MLLEDDTACVIGEPNSCLAWVKLKLSFIIFSLIGDILRSHLVWFAKERFSDIALEYTELTLVLLDKLFNDVLELKYTLFNKADALEEYIELLE